MTDTMVSAGIRATATMGEQSEFSPIGEMLRDIARGGISGAIVGVVVGGLGGRLMMRLAAILHPDAVGALTENGNRIGDITMGGTLFLVLFGPDLLRPRRGALGHRQPLDPGAYRGPGVIDGRCCDRDRDAVAHHRREP